MMQRSSAALMLAALLLTGCERSAPEKEGDGIDPGNPLEMAARERGIVRSEASAPTGVFERSHDLGRDAMCVVPDGVGQWRFAMTAAFGPGLACTATGRLNSDGDAWRLRFAGVDGCEILAREEDDELLMPGDLPPQCAKLCPDRASFAGLRLPRASWSEEDAKDLRMRDRRGNMIRPCGD